MPQYPLEVADIFRQYGDSYRQTHGASMSRDQHRTMRAIELCRTVALGGHIDQCDTCGRERNSYNSCRNRHCPKCQSLKKAEWLEARQADLLPVEYFHVVFTVPEEIAAIALQNKQVVYDILFRATKETLHRIAADPKHLGAEIGFVGILHTWGQNLLHHPHIHYAVPGGGLSPDGSQWISSRKGFFLPVKVLSRLFKGLFLCYLKEAFDDGQLQFFGNLHYLSQPGAFSSLLSTSRKKKWVVYAKPPFGGPEQVLDYLGRYTHRVAISNNRLLSLENGKVMFRLRDYTRGNISTTMTIETEEFIRRFLLHVLPNGFVRIRHFGFLSCRNRKEKLARCRHILGISQNECEKEESNEQDWKERYEALTGKSLDMCPACHKGHMVRVKDIQPVYLRNLPGIRVDTS
jgi:hypothetical protein